MHIIITVYLQLSTVLGLISIPLFSNMSGLLFFILMFSIMPILHFKPQHI